MSKDCEHCDRLQDKAEGSAPLRGRFKQPTMYDHIPQFVQYKSELAKQERIKTITENLLRYNEKFTDFKVDKKNAEKMLSKFSTQDMAKFRQQVKTGTMDLVPEPSQPVDLWKQLQEAKPVDSLTNISRSPINCPVEMCRQTVGITSVFAHFLRDHQQEFPVDCIETFAGHSSFLTFSEAVLRRNENICLGTLAYGGVDGSPDTLPGLCGVCKPNSLLPEDEMCWLNHLPILIMACKTTLAARLGDKALVNEVMQKSDSSRDIFIIWLTTVESTRNIYYTITVYSQNMSNSRSIITAIRNLRYSQDPVDFLSRDTNYLMLTRGDMDLLSEGGTAQIEIEIVVHDFS